MADDDLYLTVGDQVVTGWTEIRVTRGIERLPSDFDIGLTELYPGELTRLVIEPGMSCEARLGDDVVISGYIDNFIPSMSRSSHSIRVTGRSKCADLIDCAAEWPGGQISNANILGVATKLGQVYGPAGASGQPVGIPVSSDVPDLVILPQTNVMLGESAFEIIDRLARFSAVLAYDLPDGSLFLTRVGSQKAASGFREGDNVEEASVRYSADQCYSTYSAFIQSADTLMDLGASGNLIGTATDPNVKRHRGLIIISEGGGLGNDIAVLRAKWEAARRRGRSRVVHLVTDSWRDAAGALWQPNTLVPVSLPRLKLESEGLLISEVTFQRDAYRGTTAALTLMAPEAFAPQPINLTPLWGDVSQVAQ
ncbi:prophage tail gpP-like protein [Pseudomonas nitritireducens]|uniref:Prophage tail gpP-like protein n=1 Tax=Pseudomonas nitroreducens TaxID=46680 RepID=A0A7W7KIZ7_PSENT|nr:hypothetical protein [Pseudomonas nitritireducens]MBB4863356.1 prophage tail gpP-like protein [Pseudomonas nitritireducens]